MDRLAKYDPCLIEAGNGFRFGRIDPRLFQKGNLNE